MNDTAALLMTTRPVPRWQRSRMTCSVSIVIPSRTGRLDSLRAQLARQSLQGWELAVVAGVSPAARARNLGAAQVRGDILIFLDDDITFGHAQVLAELVKALESLGPYAAVGAPRIAANMTGLMGRAVLPEHQPLDHVGPTEVSWHTVGTSCFALRRQAFLELGGFDEQLVSGEDYELSYRLVQRGGAIYALGSSWVYYYPPATMREIIQKIVWYEWGNAQVARKHPQAGYRLPLASRWHAAAYLALRTAAVVPLMFVQVSYHHRRPRLAFQPQAALCSYLGAWVYCWSWFAHRPAAPPRAPARAGASTA